MATVTPKPPNAFQDEGRLPEKAGDGPGHPDSNDCPNALLVGKLISDPVEDRSWVIEQRTSKGDLLAIKYPVPEWELEMIKYAAAHKILVPKPHYCCSPVEADVNSSGLAMVTERVAGKTLFDVWDKLTQAEQASVKDQLRAQIALMRACTQDTIGRLSTLPHHTVCQFRSYGYCGPFSTEKDFDRWRLGRVYLGSVSRLKWKIRLSHNRRQSSGKFVLTLGNLSPRNIIVQGSTITGIVGWEDSGFFPEYMEYAVAMAQFGDEMEWWASVLRDVFEPCSDEMVKFTEAVRKGYQKRCTQGFGPMWAVIPLTCCFVLTCCCCGLYADRPETEAKCPVATKKKPKI